MKANIHPQYYKDVQVVCSCGNTFNVGSTKQSIHIQLCNKCHPFFTGQQRFVDTASRIDKFQKKIDVAKQVTIKKKAEKERAEYKPLSLREMLQSVKR